jgi:hypothetical protein
MATSVSGGRNRRESPTMSKQLVSGNITITSKNNTTQCNVTYNGKSRVETLQLTVKTTPYSVA